MDVDRLPLERTLFRALPGRLVADEPDPVRLHRVCAAAQGAHEQEHLATARVGLQDLDVSSSVSPFCPVAVVLPANETSSSAGEPPIET